MCSPPVRDRGMCYMFAHLNFLSFFHQNFGRGRHVFKPCRKNGFGNPIGYMVSSQNFYCCGRHRIQKPLCSYYVALTMLNIGA